MVVGAMAAAKSLSLSAPVSSSSAPSSVGCCWEKKTPTMGPAGGKRFPILGPTRQDTEMYFRRRRSARHRIRTTNRPLVTRSADRVVPADYSPARLSCTPLLSASLSTSTSTPTPATAPPSRANTSTHLKGFRHATVDPNLGHSHTTTNTTDTVFHTGPETQAALPPAFEHVAGTPQKSDKPASAFARAGGSPTAAAVGPQASLLGFSRSASFHAGSGVGAARSGGGGGGGAGKKKYDIPIKFLSESGQIRTSELTHRVSKTTAAVGAQNQNNLRSAGQAPKTLQPSKYGFHRRSKSPTFKRLVQVAEKLQNVLAADRSHHHQHQHSHDLSHHHARHAASSSTSGARFPAVSGASAAVDGAACGGGRGGGRGGVGSGGVEEEEDGVFRTNDNDNDDYEEGEEEATGFQPHDFLFSKGYHSVPRSNPGTDPNAGSLHHRRSAKRHSLTASSSNKHGGALHSSGQSHSHSQRRDVATSTGDSDLFPNNGWGAWEVDCCGGVGEGEEEEEWKWEEKGGVEDPHHPLHYSLPHGLQGGVPPENGHTELHLFLPRLADAASEEGSSGAAPMTSPPDRLHHHHHHHRSRLPLHHPTHLHHQARGKPSPPPPPSSQTHHPPTASRPPHHPHSVPSGGPGERSSRPQSRRFTSPVRAQRRDRTPNNKRRSGGGSGWWWWWW
ncbi:uncharacterized protein LOC143283027 [Babylonia areolata]|uniref:uncharacterized protein LOC143283027 n=1 Tax=Babylonia areolata TaxID=304850 RepID=UPI003FD5C604